MATSVFQYDSYKTFIKESFAQKEKGGRGQKLRLAEFLGCQDSYVSLVLSGDRDFSVEQGEGVARFLHLTGPEKEVFLLLLLRDRSGTAQAKEYFSQQIEEKRKKFVELRARVKIDSDLSDADKMIYYSSALPAKVHMLLTVPGDWSVEKLARRFRTSAEKIAEVCRFLESKGFIKEKAGKFHGTSKYLFLDKNSPFIVQHHNNWRLDSMRAMQEKREEGMHLSMAVTLSEKDAEALKRKIAEFVQEASSFIKDSKEETLMAFCLDYYRP